ncbi:MAG TPA: glutamine--fructose-6-phosphate transaminase (isomerizing) [Vicinamibacterales bacterium]
MCGIVGYVGHRDAAGFLMPALRRLDYRGYDSAGLATVNGHGLEIRKAPGRITALEAMVAGDPTHGCVGIAHTRWATHGRPTALNAHPHTDCIDRFAIAHNGIIENHLALRQTLAGEGHRFRSETDTEVIAHLIEQYREAGLPEAVRRAARDLKGSYAIACVDAQSPRTLVAARGGGSPLIIGLGDDEVFLASDVPALLGITERILVLGEGEMAVLTPNGVQLLTLDGHPVSRRPVGLPWSREAAEKGGFPHFMLKEIFEQPEAIRNTLRERVDAARGLVSIPELAIGDRELASLERLQFVACGTSWHAALVGKYLIEALARVPVTVDIASEFRYREPLVDSNVLTVAISQSGETADTLAALQEARTRGSRAVSICNVVGSSLAREADGVVYTRACLEIGVASTKAFTAQLAAVLLLAVRLGRARGTMPEPLAQLILQDLETVPDRMTALLEQSEFLRDIAARFTASRDFLYLGRGIHHPMALEGALKLKEISYIHAEGYAAGEMKHGSIALVHNELPVVAIALRGPTYAKMASNIEEVKAREGIVIALTTEGDREMAGRADCQIPMPPAVYWIQPLLVALPLQLLAYHLGTLRGCDVDQPRNLAKSVTVE